MAVTRRVFLETAGAGTLLAAVPAGWAGAVYASDAPETPKLRIGIIALTDCASIVMAHELGLFKKHGIESIISKEASWAVIRDRLSLGENQATHMLLGMPYASTMGLLGSPVRPMIIPLYLNRNGQAITLSRSLLDKGAKTPQQIRPLALEGRAKGDPFVLGRGGEEVLACRAAGIPVDVVPGVSSAVAVPAAAGIPVTHRGLGSSFAVVTGHEDPAKAGGHIHWEGLARAVDTLVILMGAAMLPVIAARLIAAGRDAATPAAVIERGTTAAQRSVTGTLGDIAERASALGPPAVVVIGPVAGLGLAIGPPAAGECLAARM